MAKVLLVGLGGFLGSSARYLVGLWLQQASARHAFPYGTLAVNVLGCLLIGFLAGLGQDRTALSPELKLFVARGWVSRRIHHVFGVRA